MEPLPAPPPFTEPPRRAGPKRAARPARPARPGQLVVGWGTLFWGSWLLVAAAFIAVAYSSREKTGLATWWLGPESEPRFILVTLLPFVAPSILAIMGVKAMRHLPWFGIAGALATAAVAAGDVHDVPRYAAIEFVIAGGALAVSLACFAGLVRADDTAQPDDTAPPDDTEPPDDTAQPDDTAPPVDVAEETPSR
ncbi:MAG: hypothetical protein Q7V88_06905 [Actinomycetota bacterium]|nr:hypothetical protein [Actinomycetota bacterium]